MARVGWPALSSAVGRHIGGSARLKRAFCLFLHRHGWLKPLTFVQWLATYQCNFGCPFCEVSAGPRGNDELTTDEAKLLVDDLGRMKVRRFVISGGEPLIRADVPEVMRHANARGMAVGLVTNGYRVEERWRELEGVDYFCYHTSIDGTEVYHDRIRRRKHAFRRAMRGLELFGGLRVRMRVVKTVVHPGNIDQLEPLRQILVDAGAVAWHLTPAATVGRASSGTFGLSGEQLRAMVDFVELHRRTMNIELSEASSYLACLHGRTLGRPFFCGAGLTRCTILPDGAALGCLAYDSAAVEGNIRETPFPELWRREFRRYRTDRLPAYCKGCRHAKVCQGGCRDEMDREGHCLKPVWEGGR